MPPAPLSETARKNLALTLETALRSSLGEALGASWKIRDAEDAMRSALAESRTVLLRRSRGAGPPPNVPDAGPLRAAVCRALAPLLLALWAPHLYARPRCPLRQKVFPRSFSG